MVRVRLSIFLLLTLAVSTAIAGPPVFVIGNVPPQDVDQNATLSFQLQSPKLGPPTFAYSIDAGYPAPVGAITLNPTSGLFTYTPIAADKFQFRITFTSSVAGNTPDFQSVLIFPRRTLPPETDLLNRVDRIPDPTGPDYILETTSANATPEVFNGVTKTTRNIEISGKTIIFQASDPAYSRLYNSYNGAADLKSFTIYAETLVIRSPLSLPGTNLKIYARDLQFLDLPNQSLASINTTPLPLGSNGVQFSNGKTGQRAGDIAVWVKTFTAAGNTARLIANGGRGQDAGEGQAGASKAAYVPPGSNPPYFIITQTRSPNNIEWPYGKGGHGNVYAANGAILQPPFPAVVSVTSDRCGEFIMGQPPRWPEDGNDAIPPGTPGPGGSGATITASLQIAPGYLQFSGGASGQPGKAQSGGPPQEPSFSAWLKTINGTSCLNDHFDAQVTALHTSVAGKNAPAIPGTQGANGSFSLAAQTTSAPWLHPNFLQMVMAHAKDTYRGGNIDASRLIFQDYADLLDANQNPAQEFALTFQSTRQEIQGLLTRIGGKLDYFGNTAGWVPLLSLAPYVNAFSSEVDAAIPLLYLSRWLQANSDRNTQSVVALQDGLTKLQKDIQASQSAVKDAAAAAPDLQQQIGKITADISDLQAAIQQREATLLAQADRNVQDRKKVPFWKQGCRIIGAVCQALPFYQPALGLVGQALIFASNVNVDEPLPQLFNDGVSMWNQLKGATNGATLDKSAQDWQAFVAKIDPSDATSLKDYGQGLVDIYKQKIAPNQQAVIDQFKVQQVSDAEVKAEFEKLEAQDSSLNDLIQRATDLQQFKASFANNLANMLQKIAAQQATISKDLLLKDSLQQNVASTSAQFDHKLMVAVRDLELRARERLFRYQYYMAKAYEYRMLQQYPSDLNLDSTIKQIDSLITKSYPPDPSVFTTVNPTTIKSVYLTAVREIVDKTLQDSSSQSIEKQQLLKFDLTADELAALNKLPIAVNQWLPIDVSQRIAPLLGEDNRHISDIVFDQVKVQTTGAIGSFARMRILVAHDGRSVQSLNGHQYNFYFGLRPEDTPFFWDASYDIPSGSLDQAKPSPSAIYQLISLLQLPPTSDPSVLFARPGADKVILYVRREPQPGTLNAQITKLTLAVKVDFFRRNSNLVTLSVQSGNVQPYIGIDKSDVTNRADGLGNFQRTYNSGDRVTLSAEPFHGNLKFKYWSDDLGNIVGTSPTLIMTLTSAVSVHPVYSSIPTVVTSKVGAYSAGYWVQDLNGNFAWDGTSTDRLTFWSLGRTGEVPVYGDWNGDGKNKIGLYVDGTWLLDYNGNGVWDGPNVDKIVYFGGPGYSPIVGDWNGSGTTKIGVHQNGTWLLDYNGNFAWDGPGADKLLYFGGPGYTPVVGDWNGSGTTKIGVHQNGTWLLDYNGNFAWDGPGTDKLVFFGGPGYTPVLGDWNGSGSTKIGAYKDGLWLLDYNGNFSWDGTSTDKLIFFGGVGYTPMVGDWNGSGTTKVGAYLNGLWVLDVNGNFIWDPPTDQVIFFGGPGQIPIVGKW